MKRSILLIMLLSFSTSFASAEDVEEVDPVTALITKLGSPDFHEREAASKYLAQLGNKAIPAIKKLRDSNDGELRWRAEEILRNIEKNTFQQKLSKFRGGDLSVGDEIPGWTKFAARMGEDKKHHALFLEMYDAMPELFAAIEDSHPKMLNSLFVSMVNELRSKSTRRDRNQLKKGEVTTALFLASDPKVELTDVSVRNVTSLILSAHRAKLITFKKGEHHYSMLAEFVRREHSPRVFVSVLQMCDQLEEKALGIELCRKALKEADGNSGTIFQYAVSYMAFHGTKQDIDVMLPHLDDKILMFTRRLGKNEQVQIETRDLVLAALLHLTKQDPKKYGMTMTFKTSLLRWISFRTAYAFKNDGERKKARAKWDKWLKEFRAKPQAAAEQPQTQPAAPTTQPKPEAAMPKQDESKK